MIRITLIATTYPAPDEDGYCCYDDEVSMREEEVTFRELVDLLRRYSHPSSWPITTPRASDWTYDPDWDQDYRTGDWTAHSLHYAPTNAPRKLKYWRKAWRVAGVTWTRRDLTEYLTGR